MKPAAAKTTNSDSGKAPFTAGVLGLTFLDTTWRMATPVIVFVIGGIIADRSFGTKPWLTLLAVVLGFAVSGVLLKKQLEAVEREERKK